MRWILQLGLMMLMLLGVGNRAWGRASASPAPVEWDCSPSRTFDRGVDAPPRRLASGEAAAWGLDVELAGTGPLDSTPTTAGPVVVTFHGTAFLMCPGAPPPVIGSFRTTTPAWVAVGPNVYAYVKQNPWTAFDPHGLAIETVWDVANVVHDVGRLVKNGAEMAYGAAATGYHKATGNSGAADASWNGIGGDWGELKQAAGDTALDVGATLVPGLPAGIQKGVRAGMNAYDKIEKANAVVNTGEKLAEGDIVGAVNEAAGALPLPGGKKAKRWFIANYFCIKDVGRQQQPDGFLY